MQFLVLGALIALGVSLGVVGRGLVATSADVSSDQSFNYISGEIQHINFSTRELALLTDAPVISYAPSRTTFTFDDRASWYSATNIRESGVITRNFVLPIRPENVRPGDRAGIIMLRSPNGEVYPELITTTRPN